MHTIVLSRTKFCRKIQHPILGVSFFFCRCRHRKSFFFFSYKEDPVDSFARAQLMKQFEDLLAEIPRSVGAEIGRSWSPLIAKITCFGLIGNRCQKSVLSPGLGPGLDGTPISTRKKRVCRGFGGKLWPRGDMIYRWESKFINGGQEELNSKILSEILLGMKYNKKC